jgi:hypothetical protein
VCTVPAITEPEVLFAFVSYFVPVLCRCVIVLIRGLFNDAISSPRLKHNPKPRIISNNEYR